RFDQGIGTPINIPEAVRAYNAAAAAGNPLAKARLARIDFGGLGVVADRRAAERLVQGIVPDLLRAAAANDPIAQTAVGTMCRAGLGGAGDGAEGRRGVQRAAGRGLPRAEANLGVVYELGEAVPADIARAAAWLNAAALHNSAMGQSYLADLYHAGR